MRITLTLSILTLSSVATAQWSQQAPATSPTPRIEAMMALDLQNGETVLFGGADNAGFPPTNFADTWTWDGTNWNSQSPANSPPGRYFGAMAYDVLRQRTVLYGGLTATFFGANYLDDTWEWDGSNWTQVATANTPGSLIGNPGVGEIDMAYDLVGQTMVMFGGELFQGIVPAPAVTLEYDGADWVQTSPAVSPPRRSQTAMCSAPTLMGVLMFGGTNFNNPPGPNGEIVWNDLWVYSASTDTWTQLSPTGTVPPARAGAMLEWIRGTNCYVMHGGYDSTMTGITPLSDTWIYDGAANTWTEVTGTVGSPTAPLLRFETAESPDGSHVLFGGSTGVFGTINNDTWTLNGAASSGTYGAGCPGSFGTPTLSPTNDPVFGTSFSIAATNLDPAATVAFMSIGFSDTTSALGAIPVDLSTFGLGAGCELWMSGDTTTLFGVSGGSGTYVFPVPGGPDFMGLVLFYQGASIDAGATGGIAVTNAVEAALGY